MRRRTGLSQWMRSREAGLGLLLALLVTGFAIVSPEFRSPSIVLEQSRFWVETGILATAMFGVIIAGGIDLSVGSMLALCGVTTVRLHAEAGLPMAIGALAGLAVGAAAGVLNGAAAALVRIPDFVVTLAGMVVYRGLAQLVAQNRVYSGLPESYLRLGSGTILDVLPVQWLILLGTWAAGFVLFHRSRLGRYAFALGAEPRAARAAGVPVRLTRLTLYTLSGLAAAVAAIVYTARNGTARSDDAEGFELEAITCVLLGGTPIRGGRGNLLGTILGVLVVGCLRTGLILAGVPELYRRISVGAMLIVAAAWNEIVVGERRAQRAR